MSERRFTVDDNGIYDNQEKKHFKFIAYDWIDCDIYECCENLNNLHQENQQLKHYKLYEDNKRLQTIIADLKDDKNQLHKVISKLRQEVAELKTRNAVLSSKLNQIPKSIKEVWLE